jgi:flagellin FlaB
MFDDTDRGQVGIGTLIVFIALVLVAAIAAGVLINTADLLQGQAQETGEESTDQVSNNLNVESVTGLNTGSGEIDTLEFVTTLGPGADAIDISQLELQVLTSTQTTTLTFGNGASSPATEVFTAEDLSGNAVSSLSSGERVKLVVDLNTDPGAQAVGTLSSGTTAQVTLTTADGTQTTEQIKIPDIINAPEDL